MDATLALVGSLLGLAGFGFGLYQYYIAQKWKRSEFAAQQLALLAEDPQLEICCRILDWNSRVFPVPVRYRDLAPEPTFFHNWDVLAAAMSGEAQKGSFDWQETLYRDLFDHFFAYLERIEHFLSIDLISLEDVASLRYWLGELAAPRFVDRPIFIDFLRAYDYAGVLRLMERFELGPK
jgi:hypothetical protein